MPRQYPTSPKANKTALRPIKRKKGFQPRPRNAFYALVAEFKRRQPEVTAAAAWRHFASIAEIGVHDVIIAYDADADVLSYRPDPGRFEVRQIKRRSFGQQWYRIKATSFG